MKELNRFRKFLNEKEGTWGGKKPKNPNTDIPWGGKDPKNPIKDTPWGGKDPKNPAKDIPWGGKEEENVSENTSMPDIEIMGQSFNFSDICPSAHKLVQNQAIVHQGFSKTAPTVLMFAILHRDFFALEKKALGAAGITVDEYKNDVTRLYTEILNVADKLGVRDEAKEYMDMHMGKIKDAGFKASEDDGSSDRNFEEQLREVRNRIASEVEGYTDLHENDVALEAFLGEGPYGSSQTGYQVQYRTMNDKVASFDSEVFADKGEALTFAKSKESDPSIMGVQVWEFYGPGEKRGNSQYLGGEKEISYYSNPVIRQKDGELSPEELDIKKFMGNPSHIHKRYGLSMDYNLMDTIKAMKAQRKEFLASSNEE